MKVYNNGNYQVKIYEDGTKTRTSLTNEFSPKFPETIDINISNHCIHNCSFCYIDANEQGKHGDIINLFNTMDIPSNVEIAINYAEHPDLIRFIYNSINIYDLIVNMTINSKDLFIARRTEHIQQAINAGITGLGVSIGGMHDSHLQTFFDALESISINKENIVFHVINGVTPFETINKLVKLNLKILILGYKFKGRGKIAYNVENKMLSHFQLQHLLKVATTVISFDNNAIKQLSLSNILTSEEYNKIYMGDDGDFSMYIDAVTGTYNTSSSHNFIHARHIGIKSIIEMFKTLDRRPHDNN